MKIFNLFRPWKICSCVHEQQLYILNKNGLIRKYSEKPPNKEDNKKSQNKSKNDEEEDKKCSGDLGYKHKLVPCKETDAVGMWIKEPNLIRADSNNNLPERTDDFYRVIIIGAGISGLFAAARMMSCNLTDFIILEAKERLGGRVKSAMFNNTLIDLGAEYIEGASIVNPIYQFSCLNHLISENSCRGSCSNGMFLLSDARAIEGSEKICTEFNKIVEYLPVEAALEEPCGKTKVFDYIEEKMREKIDSYPEWERDDAMKMVYSLINELRAKIGVDPSSTTVSVLGSSITLPGPRIKFDEGGASLIQALHKQLPKNKIQLNKGVQTIFWKTEDDSREECKIKVRCCDGTEYTAYHVVVTVSLAALRCQNTLFSPPLPSEKLKAIHGIPFGKGGKLFLRYEEPFWLEKSLMLRFGWTKDEISDRQDWIKGVSSVEQIPSPTDNILQVSVSGREAQIMEQNKKDSAAEFLDWLDSLIGTPISTCVPIEAVASSWCNDIFTGGSNSYIEPALQKILAQPIPDYNCPQLIFAGEATEPGYIGSMHSAAKSGIRVADMIADVIKRYDEECEKANAQYQLALEEQKQTEDCNDKQEDVPCHHEKQKV